MIEYEAQQVLLVCISVYVKEQLKIFVHYDVISTKIFLSGHFQTR